MYPPHSRSRKEMPMGLLYGGSAGLLEDDLGGGMMSSRGGGGYGDMGHMGYGESAPPQSGYYGTYGPLDPPPRENRREPRERQRDTQRQLHNNNPPTTAIAPPGLLLPDDVTEEMNMFMFTYNPHGHRRDPRINGRQFPPWAYSYESIKEKRSVEFMYHPDIYKNNPCKHGASCAVRACGYLHPGEYYMPSWRGTGVVMDGIFFPPTPITYLWFKFMMLEFKTTGPCTSDYDHDYSRCHDWHSFEYDRRERLRFEIEKDEWVTVNSLDTQGARLFHPNNYKRRPCDNIMRHRWRCSRGRYCWYYHSDEEREMIRSFYTTLANELRVANGDSSSILTTVAMGGGPGYVPAILPPTEKLNDSARSSTGATRPLRNVVLPPRRRPRVGSSEVVSYPEMSRSGGGSSGGGGGRNGGGGPGGVGSNRFDFYGGSEILARSEDESMGGRGGGLASLWGPSGDGMDGIGMDDGMYSGGGGYGGGGGGGGFRHRGSLPNTRGLGGAASTGTLPYQGSGSNLLGVNGGGRKASAGSIPVSNRGKGVMDISKPEAHMLANAMGRGGVGGDDAGSLFSLAASSHSSLRGAAYGFHESASSPSLNLDGSMGLGNPGSSNHLYPFYSKGGPGSAADSLGGMQSPGTMSHRSSISAQGMDALNSPRGSETASPPPSNTSPQSLMSVFSSQSGAPAHSLAEAVVRASAAPPPPPPSSSVVAGVGGGVGIDGSVIASPDIGGHQENVTQLERQLERLLDIGDEAMMFAHAGAAAPLPHSVRSPRGTTTTESNSSPSPYNNNNNANGQGRRANNSPSVRSNSSDSASFRHPSLPTHAATTSLTGSPSGSIQGNPIPHVIPHGTPRKGWSQMDVCEWLRRSEEPILRQLAPRMLENDIDGEIFLMLNNDMLSKEMGVTSFGQRKKLLDLIDGLKETECDTPKSTESVSASAEPQSPKP